MAQSTHTGRWISKAARLALYTRDAFECVYCGADLLDVLPAGRTLDHIVARVAGGELRNPSNLVTACKHCNSSKGAKALDAWMPEAAATVAAAIARPLDVEAARRRIKALREQQKGE